jgi:signal transduction histidine kinase/ActR/RegA family two-component response regulator
MPTQSQQALLTAIQALSFARTLDDLTRVIRTHAKTTIGADGVTFVLRDAGHCYYVEEDAIAPLWKGRRFPMESCISGWVMLYGQPAVIPDIYVDSRLTYDLYRPTFVRSLVMVPVRTEAPIAAIGAYWASVHEASDAELQALQALANAAARALENAQLYADLQTAIASERHARETAETANRLKDEFLATLSHELRTPLNVIQGWLWALDEKTASTTELRQRAVAAIERNVDLQARLIEDLLDTSRAVGGRLTIDRRLVDLVAISRAVLELLRPIATAKSVTLAINVTDEPLMVRGDSDRLQQILWNVVSNAIKFTPAGGTVSLTAARHSNRAEIAVRDTGVGISSEFLPYVFDPFRQGDPGPTRRFGGLGLGLSIVKQLVDLHGGTVAAHSDGPNAGTTVRIGFPVAAVLEDANVEATARTEQPVGPSLKGLKVVVVDDDSDARESARFILEHHGAAVWEATSGEEALAIVNEHQPDVLLADLSMPGFDGFALIRCIRMLGGQSARLPAAAFSALTASHHRQQAQQAGYQGYLQKPVRAHELTAEVARLAALAAARNGSSTLDHLG